MATTIAHASYGPPHASALSWSALRYGPFMLHSCCSGNRLRVEALSNDDMGRRLPSQAGSTIPVIAPDNPSPEDDRGEHAKEILQIDVRQMIMLPGSCS